MSCIILRDSYTQSTNSQALSLSEKNALLKTKFQKYLHGLSFADEEQYVWVNKILNEAGGVNFATRLIHPGMPETEGLLLSTSTQDIKGGTPYQTELDGVLAHGEVFYVYYFKKRTSGIVEQKLSYSKLYKPFNWVVSTGIYLDDFARYVDQERSNLNLSYNSQRLTSILLITITMLCTAILIYLFERNINRLIFSYESEIKGYTDELEVLSTTDRLTSLHNRLFLDDVLEKELARFQRYRSPFSIIMLDLDRFKRVNDTYGHQQGDKVLQEFSKLVIQNTRQSDVVGRWGGEEFLIICKECDLLNAVLLANSIRDKVNSYEFSVVGHMNASFGVSTVHQQDSPEQMIERADKALYKAKTEGRNRVVDERQVNTY